MLARTADARYPLRLRPWHWCCAAVSQFNFRDAAHPILGDLVRLTGKTVHCAVWSEGDAVYIDRVNDANVIRFHSNIGGRTVGHTTASGLCLLALQGAVIQAEATQRLRESTPKTIVSLAHLRNALETIWRQGYAFRIRPRHTSGAGLVAPIRSDSGEVAACLSSAGPTERNDGRTSVPTELVQAAASHDSRSMGVPAAYRWTPVTDNMKEGRCPQTCAYPKSRHPSAGGDHERRAS